MSGSVAVLASAVDSVLDLAVSLFNYFAVANSEKPADDTFNYGRGKIEAIASVIEGVIITISGFYILYESVKKALANTPISDIEISVGVMIVSFVITFFLVTYLNLVAKKTNSLVIKSDALHYKTDMLTNGAVLVSLILIKLTGLEIVDSIIGGAIAVYIIYSAYTLIKEGVLMLMDVALDDATVDAIQSIIESQQELSDYHYLKTRRSGKYNFVDVHLVFNESFSLMAAHKVSDRVEDKIRALDSESEWVINIHLDPVDDSDETVEQRLNKHKHETTNL